MARAASKYPTNDELLALVERHLNRGLIVALHRVRCQGCATTGDIGTSQPGEAQRVLRRMGWNRRGSRHYCPTCLADGTASRDHALEMIEEVQP